MCEKRKYTKEEARLIDDFLQSLYFASDKAYRNLSSISVPMQTDSTINGKAYWRNCRSCIAWAMGLLKQRTEKAA